MREKIVRRAQVVRARSIQAGGRRAVVEALQSRLLLTISGSDFSDLNANGLRDAGEPGLSGVTVFLDASNNGAFDAGETATTTDASGNYSFPGTPLSNY